MNWWLLLVVVILGCAGLWIAFWLECWCDPFDIDPDSRPWDQQYPGHEDMSCPDTQPTNPGALDHDVRPVQ